MHSLQCVTDPPTCVHLLSVVCNHYNVWQTHPPEAIGPQLAKVGVRGLIAVAAKVAGEGLPRRHEAYVRVHVGLAARAAHRAEFTQVDNLCGAQLHWCVCVCACVCVCVLFESVCVSVQ